MTTKQLQELTETIQQYQLAFSTGPNDVGKLHYYQFELPLIDENAKIYEPSRPVPIAIQPAVTSQIDSWIDQDIIEESSSPFNIPLIIVRKADGSIRTSLDARRINLHLKDDRFPVPNMRELLWKVGHSISSGPEYTLSLDGRASV